MTSFKRITPPATEPVTLADAKAHARIDSTADDALVTALITAARQWAEQYTGRAFIAQTWQAWVDGHSLPVCAWGDGQYDDPPSTIRVVSFIELKRPPLVSVTAVTVYDDDDTGTTWPSDNYFVDTVHEPGRLALRSNATWPTPTRLTNGMKIEYTAGYGSSACDVPEAIKLAIKQLVAHWYEHRGEAVVMSSTRHGSMADLGGVNVPLLIQALLDPYRVHGLGAS